MNKNEEKVKQVFTEILEDVARIDLNSISNFNLDTSFFENGLFLDSLDLLDVVSGVEERLEIQISPSDLKRLKTLRNVIACISEILENKK